MEPAGKKDEQYWLTQFIGGDKQALSYFFDLHYKPLCYFAGRLLQNEEEAEDIVSTCFLKLWQKHTDFQTAENIKAFLYISCRNGCLDHLKHLKRKSVAQQEYIRELERSEEGILHQIIEAEFLRVIKDEIETLPDNCRDIFKMLYFEGKKTQEIAIELGLPIKTIRNRRAKAVELLKTSFLKKGITDAMWLFLLMLLNNR